MLRFFRNIRYKLATDNKIGQFFRYALGEIVLVVIGILIALQVNNRNENRIPESKKNQNPNRLETKSISVKKFIRSVQNIVVNQSPALCYNFISQGGYSYSKNKIIS